MSPSQFWRQLLASRAQCSGWVIASVVQTAGSTPRKSGAQMALGFQKAESEAPVLSTIIGSVGGGAGEAKVIRNALQLLATNDQHGECAIDLRGDTPSATSSAGNSHEFEGVCGGTMRVILHRCDPQRTYADIFERLSLGDSFRLCAETLMLSSKASALTITSWPIVLISGAGHCGQALLRILTETGFDVLLTDTRQGQSMLLSCENVLPTEPALEQAEQYVGGVILVLLSRNLSEDLSLLAALERHPARQRIRWLGVMGSKKRLRLLQQDAAWLASPGFAVVAPVGLNLGGETPAEIAVAIAAQIIAFRNHSEHATSEK